MAIKNWKDAAEHFSNKENVLIWFGERDINLYSERTKGCLHLSKFKWVDGWLFYSVKGEHDGWESISKTEPHHIDVCQTHRKDGTSIRVFEPYSLFRGTFKDISNFIKEIEVSCKEHEEMEKRYSKVYEEKKRKNAINLINNVKIGDILIGGDGWDSSKHDFEQIISVDPKNYSITVRRLNVRWIYPPAREDGKFSGWGGITCNKDDFSEECLDTELNIENIRHKLWDGTPQNK